MNSKIKVIGLFLCLFLLLLFFYYHENEEQLHGLHKKFEVLYYEGGPYYDYYSVLTSLIKGLQEINLIEPFNFPDFEDKEDTRQVWNYVCDHAKSSCLSFLKENYYSSNWDNKIRKTNLELVLKELNKKPAKINLVIAMGTWAGLDLANEKNHVKTVVLSTTDPVEAGILDKDSDEKFSNVFIEYIPDIYFQQLNLFHAIFRFKKLGIAYEDTNDGKSYIAYDSIVRVSKLRNFEIVPCLLTEVDSNISKIVNEGKNCVDYLSTICDAIYFGDQSFLKYEYMPCVISATLEHKIPTWSHHGIEHVRRGILMSNTQVTDFINRGLWEASVIERIIHGSQPSDIDNIWIEHTELSINLEVAKIIGFKVPDSLIAISDNVITHIDGYNGEKGKKTCGPK